MFQSLLLFSVGLVVPGFFTLMWTASTYNRLARLRERFQAAYHDLETQLAKRHDLILEIANLTECCFAASEGTKEAMMAARNAAIEAHGRAGAKPGDILSMEQLVKAEDSLETNLIRFTHASAANPNFQLNENLARIKNSLELNQKEIERARMTYNDAVMGYNSLRETFPTSLITLPFSFDPAMTFQPQKN